MERTWLETIQLLGLDLEVALIVLMLACAWCVDLAKAALRKLRRPSRRPGATPTRPFDAWPSQAWGPSH